MFYQDTVRIHLYLKPIYAGGASQRVGRLQNAGKTKQIDVLPWIGEVDHALVWVAIISALGGTLVLTCYSYAWYH